MKYVKLGPIAVVLAAFLWSLDGLLRRELYSLPPSIVVFWEHILGLIILLPFVTPTLKEFRKLTRSQWITIIIVALLSGSLGTIFYTAALGKVQFIQYSVVVLLQQLQPLFAIVAAALLLKEPITKRFALLAVIAIAATYFVSFPDLRVNFSTGTGTALAALLAIGAAASWGTSTALSKYSLKDTSFLHITAIRFALAPIFALLIAGMLGQAGSLGSLQPIQWQYLIAITLSTGLVALAIYYFGLQRVPASRTTILELTWPVSAVLIGYTFMGERFTVTQMIGAVVLIVVMSFIARESNETNTIQSNRDKGGGKRQGTWLPNRKSAATA